MRLCEVEECGRKHYGKGYCHKHWQSLVYMPSRPVGWRKEETKAYYKRTAGRRVAKQRLKTTGATPEMVEAMLKAQESKCATCSKEFDGTRGGKYVVDHCHSTKKIRGLLCSYCNIQLGAYEKNSSLYTHKFPEYLRG